MLDTNGGSITRGRSLAAIRWAARRKAGMRAALLAWLAVGLVLALLSQLTLEYLWILAAAPILIWVVAGMTLLGFALWRARNRERRRSHVLASVAVLFGWLLFWPVTTIGNLLTMKIRFAVHRASYEEIVSRQGPGDSGDGLHRSGTIRYIVDSGPPLRIAFIWPGGIIDNWCGAIYDPTGSVMLSSKFDGNWDTWYDQVPSEVIKLFGGDLLYCRELSAPYYHCCFT